MSLQILALVACLLAAVLQFAVYRSPDHIDTRFRRMGRRMGVAALMVAVLYIAECLLHGKPAGPQFLVLALYGMSQGLFAASDLLPHLDDKDLPWSSRLNSSP